MRKTLLFLSSLIFLLTGCSNDDLDMNSDSGTKHIPSENVRWYGTKRITEPQTRGVADGSKRWNAESGIFIKFLNTPSDPQLIGKIKTIASEWEQYAGINFHFVDQDIKTPVRIAFDWNGNDWLTWSYTGTDAKFEHAQNQPTAVFGGLEYDDEETFRGDVLRVFGQILGLEYEQRHQEWSKNGYWKSETQLQRYWEGQFDGYSMDWDEIREYVFDPLTEQNALQLFSTEDIDEQSVMAWPYYNKAQTTKLLANFELSEGDKQFIAQLYPKKSLPTIQEAWVDSGYFTWTDNTKTALKITSLGRQQEYLPDVSDGEQLTSAYEMFAGAVIKKAPIFNTSNITKFTFMFWECRNLSEVPKYDTSKAVDIEVMFAWCRSLVEIPEFDFSNAVKVSAAFMGTGLTRISNLKFPKGEDFYCMFQGTNLVSVDNFEAPNAKSCVSMFQGCSSLTRISNISMPKVVEFGGAFLNGCESLKYVENFDASGASGFPYMFSGCSSLEYVSNLNTSSGRDFRNMFENCASLKSKPELDLSNATDITDMYKGTPYE